jgi:hypothetical protein
MAAPQAWVQPVALARNILSPNSWVSSFTYGVSPQPAQAPLNSTRGWRNWLPFRVNLSKRSFFSGMVCR